MHPISIRNKGPGRAADGERAVAFNYDRPYHIIFMAFKEHLIGI
jgi:hypothetical protein